MDTSEMQTLRKNSKKEELTLPFFVTDKFLINKLIHRSPRTRTYLLTDKSSGRLFLLKARPISERTSTDNEAKTLKRLEELGITSPRVILHQDFEDGCYLIREYIPGETLAEYEERRGGIDESELVTLGILILERLRTLHELDEPIIHRDLKPKNILLIEDNETVDGDMPEIALIDYDTARIYKEEASSDTFFMGTKETAAPEQYGFAQSDVRTDLYGVGKTLIHLATGTYNEKLLEEHLQSHKLIALLRKTVSLDKKDRPESAAKMIQELVSIKHQIRRRRCLGIYTMTAQYEERVIEQGMKAYPGRRLVLTIVMTVLVVAVGVGAFFCGKMIGNGSYSGNSDSIMSTSRGAASEQAALVLPPTPTHKPEDIVDFHGSKTMELAIRTALGSDERIFDKKTITYRDLAGIQKFYAIGDQSYIKPDSYQNTDNEDQLLFQNGEGYDAKTVKTGFGDIRDLSLLTEMPNLEKVFISHQKITDLTPITGLDLHELAIYDCPVSDYSPLSGLKHLEKLVLMKCNGHDLSFLLQLKELNSLSLGRMTVDSLNILKNKMIISLQLERTFVKDDSYDAVGDMPALCTLYLWNTSEDIVKKIGSCPEVQELEIQWTSLQDGLAAIGDMPSLRTLNLSCSTLPSMKGINRLSPYHVIVPNGVGLDWLPTCPSVQSIDISMMTKVNYDVLKKASLSYVYVNEKQYADIEKNISDHEFEIREV